VEKVARLSNKERSELFRATAGKKGVIEALIEKDFWVCFVLKSIFENNELKEEMLFKGGTSLSKVYNIINRFSEDIDLILDWRVLGITDEEAWAAPTTTQQDIFNKRIDQLARVFIQESIAPSLAKTLAEKTDGQMQLTISPADGHVVTISYPASFTHSYLLDHVKLEIGPRASRIPHESVKISSYAAQEYPHLFTEKDLFVKVITSERSFWEKATILHQISYSSESKQLPPRCSRHFYDVFQMAHDSVKTKALDKIDLLNDVVEFKKRFYRDPGAHYDLAKAGTFKMLPSAQKQTVLAHDYKNMREMLFGIIPEFSDIMRVLQELENEINNR
jgi:hypothetical protein